MTVKKTYSATIPPFSTWTETRQALEAEAQSRLIPVSLARICHEAILAYIDINKLYEKHKIEPPVRRA